MFDRVKPLGFILAPGFGYNECQLRPLMTREG